MILVTKSEKDRLDKMGLLQRRKTGPNPVDQNFMVTNRTQGAKKKSYYIVESLEVLAFLEKYDTLNLQRINQEQLNTLINSKMIYPDKVQHSGEYVPGALAFVSSTGQIRIKKLPKLMVGLGIWKDSTKTKR